MNRFPHGETVMVSRPGGFDRNGDPLEGATHEVEGCVVYPSSMDETPAGTTIDADYTLLGPHGADIAENDSLTSVAAPGVPLYVKGVTWQVVHPMTGWAPGCRVLLTLKMGGTA